MALNAQNDPLWAGAAEIAREGYRAQCKNLTNNCLPGNAPNVVSFKGSVSQFGTAEQDAVEKEICNGNPVMLKFAKAGGGQHFMLATGYKFDVQGNKTFILNNPGTSQGSGQVYETDLKRNYPSILGDVLYHPSSDPSMMFITAPVNVHFVVTDPLGRRAGFNPTTQTTYSEIPGADYSDQSIDTPNEDGFTPSTLVRERYFASSQDVPSGEFQVQVFATESGNYYLDHRSYDLTGTTNDANYKTGVLAAGSSETIILKHSTSPVGLINAQLKIEDYRIEKINKKRGMRESNLAARGKLLPFSKAALELKSTFQFAIGGLNGYLLSLPADQFKVVKNRKETTFIYNKNGVEIEISSTGEFKMKLEKVDLSMIDSSQLEYLRVSMDTINGDIATSLKCSHNICSLEDRKHHVHNHGCRKHDFHGHEEFIGDHRSDK